MIDDHYADIILPLAVKGLFTYAIPVSHSGKVEQGSRVLVQFGQKKLYTGIVARIHNSKPEGIKVREVIKVLDPHPIVNDIQLKFWKWLSEYYMCSIGEVMKAAIPSDLCPEGVAQLPVAEKYRPREETFLTLSPEFDDEKLNTVLDRLARAPKQYELLTVFLDLSGYEQGRAGQPVRKASLLREARASAATAEALVAKNILIPVQIPTGRLAVNMINPEPLKELSSAQETAFGLIKRIFAKQDIALLHGITSSGKTEVYMHLISEQINAGKQVLYLLPEISLTAQIIQRLNRHFGQSTGVFHSRFSSAERVEIWNRVADRKNGFSLVLGARSALFLPFHNLGLVIVDEEQDSSYKQHDPSPRYNARDSALVLAGLHGAKSVLGSASPSVESYHNALSGKYGLVELNERYGNIKLPDIILANSREAYRKKLMVSHFTPELLDAIDEALGNNEQVILFQNRRGFSPYIECSECGWIPKCVQCAVSLTYHKAIGRLVCHYCGFMTSIPQKCGNCGSSGLVSRGFGTEKIEDEIRIIFPKARIARMDQDTTKGKNSFDRLIRSLEEGNIDILIGTQMISKGLDIENLTVVGILNADNMLNFPDFRAHERSFQLMEQVSGRAGRRKKVGKVVIQTSEPGNRIIRLVLNHDYKNMFRLQAEERKAFNYPPFCRMIKISVKHRDRSILNTLAGQLGDELKKEFGKSVLGPEYPVISRIQLWYIKTIIIKLDRNKSVPRSKQLISEAMERVERSPGASSLRIAVDVDPY